MSAALDHVGRSIMSAIGKFAALAALCGGVAHAAPAARWLPVTGIGARADGVWRSQGYGHILVLRGGKPMLYHAAGPYCYRDPSQGVGDDDSFRLVTITSRSRIAFAASPDQTHYAFDRIAALPRACTIKRDWPPGEIEQLVAATFAELYPGFGERGRDRQKLAAALTTGKGMTSDGALYDHLTHVLAVLDDAHVGLEANIDGAGHVFEGGEAATIRDARADASLGSNPAGREKAWSKQYREGIVGLLRNGGHLVANRHILWGRIGQIGYLNIVAMGGFSEDAAPGDTGALDAALDDALAEFQGLPGVIVDVTNNRGGYDAVSLHIAGRFADRRRLAFTKRAIGARGTFQSFSVVPSPRTRYLGPVTLLTSDITVSAGETFVLAMRALPNVRQVGARTRGALSDQLAKPLPNGWALTLPAETYLDPHGRSAEGIGIDPEVAEPPFVPSHRSVVMAIAGQMQTSPKVTP